MIQKLVLTAAMMAFNIGMSAMRRIEGPQIDGTAVSLADYGTPIRRFWGERKLDGCPVIWADEIRAVDRTSKTKGGKYNEQTAFGNWAVVVAANQIEGVSQILFDEHLVLDLAGTGPVTPLVVGYTTAGKNGSRTEHSINLADHVRIYLGTDDQEVDPLIAAWSEARYGAGSATAYRGLAYIVFEGIPLEKFGNRLPTVSVRAMTAASPTIPSETVSEPLVDLEWEGAAFSTDFSRLMFSVNGKFSVWDVAARAPMVSADLGLVGSSGSRAMYASGDFLVIGDSHTKLYRVDADLTGFSETLAFGFLDDQGGVQVIADGNGDEHYFTTPLIFSTAFYVDGALFDNGDQAQFYFADAYGDVWGVFRPTGSSTTITFRRLVNAGDGVGWPDTITVTGLGAVLWPACQAVHVQDGGTDYFALERETTSGRAMHIIDPATGTVLSTDTSVPASISGGTAWANLVPGASSIWIGGHEVSLLTGETLRSPLSFSTLTRTIYDPINHAVWEQDSTADTEIIHYVDRLVSDGVTLGSIVEQVAALSGIAAEEIDAGALTQVIDGYSVASGSGKDWLDPLLEIHEVDPRPHDFLLEFLPRGSAPGAAIAHGTFAQPREDSPLYETPSAGGTDLPALVTMKFADTSADQLPALASSGPLGGIDSSRTTTLELSSLVCDTDLARQMTARWHRRRLNERQPYGLALTAQLIELEPADVRPLSLLDDHTVTARLTSLVLGADRQIVTEWRPDDPSFAQLDGEAGAVYGAHTQAAVAVPLISKGFALDIPLLNDADNDTNPVMYFAAAPYAAGTWPGATLYRALGGEHTDPQATLAAGEAATWGYATTVLGDAAPNLPDRINSATVVLQNGMLTGCTEADINANPALNRALWGDEILNFTVATLVAPKTYEVGGFRRGRRGTEWACGSHALRDVFLLLDTAQPEEMGLSDIGDNLSFKAVTAGRTASGAFPIELAPFTGRSLKPYAIAHLRGVKRSNGDWLIEGTRRTRIGGRWTGGTAIPLGEATEAYELVLGNGSSDETYTATSLPYTWTVAAQIADLGDEVMAGDLTIEAYQMSAAVGRGFAAFAVA